MITLGSLKAELKVGIFFSFFSFIFVLFLGVVTGIGFLTILFRIILFVPLFFVIGFGVIMIFRKYVPELFDVIDLSKKENDEYVDIDESDNYSESSNEENSTEESNNSTDDTNSSDSVEDSSFQETKEEDYPKLESNESNKSDIDSMLDTENGNLGKHVVVNQKSEEEFEKYEPSVIAQAVRTMMVKDE